MNWCKFYDSSFYRPVEFVEKLESDKTTKKHLVFSRYLLKKTDFNFGLKLEIP